jgi:heme/copper-type cytochrome/quinol oxidase subunit 2
MQLKIPKKLVVFSFIALFFVAIIVMFSSSPDTGAVLGKSETDTVVINVLAKAGYTPDILIAPANKQVTLRVETKNTYDCSAAFSIPQLKVDTLLPASGFTDFKIPPQESGAVISAGCSMGMYGLQVKFQ